MNKAIFLDRDGVLNSNEGRYYVWKPEDLKINPGVVEALKKWKKAGYLLIVITNQGGVSKGEYTREDVERFHQAMQRELLSQGAGVDAFYYCPHHPDQQRCLCRKPSPLMIEKALARFDIDPDQSWMIGDSERDEWSGKAAKLKTILVESNVDLQEAIKHID